MAVGDIVRAACALIVATERHFAQELTGEQVRERLIRLSEAELASRIRAALPGQNVYLSTKGRSADRDIVSDDDRAEIEVKYFRRHPQVKAIALADWRWLIGVKSREGGRADYERLCVSFFSKCAPGFTTQGRPRTRDAVDAWRFQQIICFTPHNEDEIAPFEPVAEIVDGLEGVFGNTLEPKVQFRPRLIAQSVLTVTGTQGSPLPGPAYVRFDVVGDGWSDPIWALVSQVVGPALHSALVRSGYQDLGTRRAV